MLALRSFARALPRATFRAIPVRSVSRAIVPRITAVPRSSTLKSFSTARIWREPAGDSDAELSAKLGHERDLEVQSRDPKTLPQDLADFLNDASWSVEDQPGTENIILTKQFGNEIIRVESSIADMNADLDESDSLDDDAALEDEDFAGSDVTSGGKRTINQTRGGPIDVAPQDSLSPSDRDESTSAELSSDANPFPLNLRITITKQGVGATNIIAQAQDGEIEIENIYYYPDASLVDPENTKAMKDAQNVYGGPPFEHLDLEVQQMYDTYIAERGINTQLAVFLSQYVDFKEQREYVLWLENMKRFVDA